MSCTLLITRQVLHREYNWAENKSLEGFSNRLVAAQLQEFYSTGEPAEVAQALEGYNQQKKLFKESLNGVEVAAKQCRLP